MSILYERIVFSRYIQYSQYREYWSVTVILPQYERIRRVARIQNPNFVDFLCSGMRS